jgi:hypothetical protein
MSEQYDFQAIRELLNAAFNASDISTLAFDRFHTVYQDFTAGMTKGQMITMLLDYVRRHEQVERLLPEIEQRNPPQYDRYAERLRLAAAPNPINDLNARRLRDIEGQIERELKLLNQYREQLSYESEPRRIAGIEANIERQKQSLARYQREAAELGANIALPELVEVKELVTAEPVDEEQLEYAAEEQAWYPAGLPALDEVAPEQLERFQKEVDVVLMVATEVELRAALHRLQPYPRRKRVLRAYVGQKRIIWGNLERIARPLPAVAWVRVVNGVRP